MKKLFLILCLSTATIHAMDEEDGDIKSGEEQLQAISTAISKLEIIHAQWQETAKQYPISDIKDRAAADEAVDALSTHQGNSYEPYQTVQPLALINLLTLQPESDNPHNKTMLALLSSFNKLEPQQKDLETKLQEHMDLNRKIFLQQWSRDILTSTQSRYIEITKKLQAHLDNLGSEEDFFREHKLFTRDEFSFYSKYYTSDTYEIKKDLDLDAFKKGWYVWYDAKYKKK